MKKVHIVCRMHSSFHGGHKLELTEMEDFADYNNAKKCIKSMLDAYPHSRYCIITEYKLIDGDNG